MSAVGYIFYWMTLFVVGILMLMLFQFYLWERQQQKRYLWEVKVVVPKKGLFKRASTLVAVISAFNEQHARSEFFQEFGQQHNITNAQMMQAKITKI
ncbi:MAG: hypothetical protein AB4038_19850 [Prochloraceae cyanobacterium]